MANGLVMSDKLTRQSTLGFDHFTKTSRNHTYDISAAKKKKKKSGRRLDEMVRVISPRDFAANQ